MRYLWDKVYFGQLVVKENDDIVYNHEYIFCICINNIVMNLKTYETYRYLEDTDDSIKYGEAYVNKLIACELPINIFRQKTMEKYIKTFINEKVIILPLHGSRVKTKSLFSPSK